MLKRLLRPYLRPISQWSPIGLIAPQTIVSAEFHGLGAVHDVTHNHTVAGLAPLTLAIGGMAGGATGQLIYRDVLTRSSLGWLELRSTGQIDDIGIFQIAAGDHSCVGWPLRPWNRHLQGRAQRRQTGEHNFALTPQALQHLMIAYICPRPVTLVSVAATGHENLFPMDLIGPLEGGRFSLALRRTNVSISAMRETRRVALSDPAVRFKAEVYGLGEHHSRPMVDWAALPFSSIETEGFRLHAVAEALRVRELAIEQAHEVGLHWFFIGRLVTERALDHGPQLHHTSGIHQFYREARGQSLS